MNGNRTICGEHPVIERIGAKSRNIAIRDTIYKGMEMGSMCDAYAARVLLIEDEPDVISRTTFALSESGYSVDTATDGEYGGFMAGAWDYDLIILSESIANRDDWFVVREIRRRNDRVSILLLTISEIFDRLPAELNAVALDYLIKPFTRGELLSRVQTIVQRNTRDSESVIEFGPVSVDLQSQTVSVDKRIVPLTAKEYLLLELLINRRGELVRRTEIYNRLSDHFDASLVNLVDVYISSIRRKIGFDAITTRRGLGYVMKEDSTASARVNQTVQPIADAR